MIAAGFAASLHCSRLLLLSPAAAATSAPAQTLCRAMRTRAAAHRHRRRRRRRASSSSRGLAGNAQSAVRQPADCPSRSSAAQYCCCRDSLAQRRDRTRRHCTKRQVVALICANRGPARQIATNSARAHERGATLAARSPREKCVRVRYSSPTLAGIRDEHEDEPTGGVRLPFRGGERCGGGGAGAGAASFEFI